MAIAEKIDRIRLVENHPVARFYYRGAHSHPVRRTVLVTRSTETDIVGYELREGNAVRTLKTAPLKSYCRARIASQASLGANKHREPGPHRTSLIRCPLINLIREGA
jgi:hypothetical protein